MSVMKTFKCIYVHYFNRFTFFAEISTKLFFGQHANMENRQMIPFFHLLFPLYLFVTFVFVFENSQNSFPCGPAFGLFWSVKYINLGQKLSTWAAHHTFVESRHPEVYKNLYYDLSTEES